MWGLVVQGINRDFSPEMPMADEVFFAVVSKAKIPQESKSGGSQADILEHFEIFACFQNGRQYGCLDLYHSFWGPYSIDNGIQTYNFQI